MYVVEDNIKKEYYLQHESKKSEKDLHEKASFLCISPKSVYTLYQRFISSPLKIVNFNANQKR